MGYVLGSYAIGYSGGLTAFFPIYGISIPSLILFTIPLCHAIIGYAIIRYKLMDINLAFRYATIYFLLTCVLAVPLVGVSWLTRSWIVSALLGLATTVLSPMLITKVKEKLTLAVDYLPPFKKYAGRLDKLHRLEEEILDAESVRECCDRAAESFKEHFGLESAELFLLEASKDAYEAQGSSGGAVSALRADDPFVRRLESERKPLLREMLERSPDEDDRALADFMRRSRAQVSVPVLIRNRLVSIVNLGPKSDKEMYNDLDLGDMVRLARIHGQALRSLHLEFEKRQAEDKASRDSLTGLYNRGKIKEYLTQAIERAARQGGELSVLLIDIDHFKKINDTLGHPAGDQVIKALSSLLENGSVAEGASERVAGRLGGEEFLIVFENCPKRSAAAAADRLLKEARAAEVSISPGKTVRFTVSVGVASFPADGSAAIDLIREADERMYRAKELGRNQVVAEI